MEIRNTLQQLFVPQLGADGQQGVALPPGVVGAARNGRAAPEESQGLAAVASDGTTGGILNLDEEQLLTLLFDEQGIEELKLYGGQKPRPAVLGNFLDVRG